MIVVFLWPTSLSMIISRSIHVAANGIISFFLMVEGTEKNMVQKDTCTLMFTAALFTIDKTLKQPKCPSTDERIKKKWSMYTMNTSHGKQ